MSDRIQIAVEQYISRMPPLPVSIAKILEICNDPKTSPADLNQVISLDPVLMGKVLKLINSAYYGLSQQITSLVRAIIMLGINTVKNLALSTAILGTLKTKGTDTALDMDAFWKHSLCVGVAAKLIAGLAGIAAKNQEEYFIAGLLHDVGKLPLSIKLSGEYSEILTMAETQDYPLYRCEQHILSTDHTFIGTQIAAHWKLNQEIMDVLGFHHALSAYKGQHRKILLIVVLSDAFANNKKIGYAGNSHPEPILQEIFVELGLSESVFESFLPAVQQEIEKASVFLKVAM